MRFLNDDQLGAIGYKYVLENINTISRLGNEEKYKVKPFTHSKKEQLILELENTSIMSSLLALDKDLIDDICLYLHKINYIIVNV